MVAGVAAQEPARILQELDEYPHAQREDFSQAQVIDHEVGLGAMKKVRGVWQFKESERLSGELTRYTWRIVDGFTSREVMEELEQQLQQAEGTELLFSCDGRACGHGSQWANRVFQQRLLYGRQDLQYYRVFSLGDNSEFRLAVYAAARSADRQYLHAEILQLSE
jgi:hypothetical protein